VTDGDGVREDPGDTPPSPERTGRWLTAVAITLAVGSVGVYFGRPSLLLAAVVALAYTAYPLVTAELAPSLTLVRAVDDASPAHGETVTVTVTVTNTGSRTAPDVRFADGVPPKLAVTEGTPRRAVALRPGESATVSYSVEATPGTHRFGPAAVTCYDRSGAARVETELKAGTGSDLSDEANELGGTDGADRTDEPAGVPAVSTLECSVPVEGVPSPRETLRATGWTAVDTGGSGVAFHRTREYRPGDPADRIDWRRYARTGALTTVEFRPDRRRSVVVCLDARPRSVRRAGDREADAVTTGGAAAAALATTFLDRGARVGVARIGPRFELVAPDDGRHHRERVTALLTALPEESTAAFDGENAGTEPTTTTGGSATPSASATEFAAQVDEVLERTSGAAEVVTVTPLLDEFGLDAVRRGAERGRGVAALSPDVTSDESLGAELAGVERRNRIEALRSMGVPVGNWRPGDAVRWSRTDGGVRRDGR